MYVLYIKSLFLNKNRCETRKIKVSDSEYVKIHWPNNYILNNNLLKKKLGQKTV